MSTTEQHLHDTSRALEILPAPMEGTVWRVSCDYFGENEDKLTVSMSLWHDDGCVLGKAKIAVDIYGWDAVRQRGSSLIRAYKESEKS